MASYSDIPRNKPAEAVRGPNCEEMIRVDGRAQVLEMLRAADPAFREVLLRGIEKRDPRLARELRQEI